MMKNKQSWRDITAYCSWSHTKEQLKKATKSDWFGDAEFLALLKSIGYSRQLAHYTINKAKIGKIKLKKLNNIIELIEKK